MGRFREIADRLGSECPEDIREQIARDLELADIVKRSDALILQALSSYREYMQKAGAEAGAAFLDGEETGRVSNEGYRQAGLIFFQTADEAEKVRKDMDRLINPDEETDD
ncbi:hypothetical protein ACFY2K_26175 [Kitasatospora sp. NPDC001309]|uniref:hypothetical protein n=1 Tax=Kitasatospora sp. NPDC001309 TaxID=3364013 RepID=UPI00367E6B76